MLLHEVLIVSLSRVLTAAGSINSPLAYGDPERSLSHAVGIYPRILPFADRPIKGVETQERGLLFERDPEQVTLQSTRTTQRRVPIKGH